ncbi:MAG: YdcF family protein [Lachnospiraceae bacterium]|nr:YdcF family protein [Lachnospiraceae bacterium]
MIFLIVMILCLAYYAVMYLYAGTLLSFSWFWLVIGAVSGVIHVALRMFGREALVEKLSLPVVVSFWTTVGVIAVLAVIIGISVMTGMFSRTEPGTLDYIIVLGTRVDEDKPSKSLCYRLDKAIEYLETDENLNVIVTGGQSKGADVTEAYAMTAYLIDAGVSPERITLENEAMSTRENLILSQAFIDDPQARVGVVTSSFHVYRAMELADKLGLDHYVGIAAPSDKILLPNNMVREFFAVIKEKLLGYL